MGNAHGTGFGKKSTTTDVARDISLDGKNVIVTGANTGLGKETARQLAKMGANIIMACRNMKKGANAKEEIENLVPNAKLTLFNLDLANLDSIEEFVTKFNELQIPLHILINNAGIMAIPYKETVNGFEMQFGTNHLGHFHLTNLLLPKLIEGQPARVVCLSSTAHKMEGIRWTDIKGKGTWYKGPMGRWNAYGQSKTANLLFAVELNRRMHTEGLNITANAVHPGVIKTELGRDLSGIEGIFMTLGSPFFKSVAQGAATSIYVATAPEIEGIGGKYFADCNEEIAKPYATNPRYAARLWKLSEELIKQAPRNKDKEEKKEEKEHSNEDNEDNKNNENNEDNENNEEIKKEKSEDSHHSNDDSDDNESSKDKIEEDSNDNDLDMSANL